jgi:hypothetical protein
MSPADAASWEVVRAPIQLVAAPDSIADKLADAAKGWGRDHDVRALRRTLLSLLRDLE